VPIDPGYYYGYGGSMYGTYYGPYAVPMEMREIPVEEERVPEGELTARRGMPVEATDGHAGKIDRFLLDPSTETITHLVLEEKHHLHKLQITVPVSAIDQVIDDTVYLKLDQRGVAALPAIPIKHHLWPRKGDEKTELLAIVFDDTEGASQALNTLKESHHGKGLKIIEAAVLVKQPDGTTAVKETMNSATTHGQVVGAVAGGIAGLLVGPVALVVGALVGAGAGGAVARATEQDFSQEFINSLQKLLQPGRSALVLLVEHEGVQLLNSALSNFKHVVSYQKLSDMVGAQLVGEKGQATELTPEAEPVAEHN
jgi:uncharacterized membrane protein